MKSTEFQKIQRFRDSQVRKASQLSTFKIQPSLKQKETTSSPKSFLRKTMKSELTFNESPPKERAFSPQKTPQPPKATFENNILSKI